MIAPNPKAPMIGATGLVAAVVAAAAGFWLGQGPAPAVQSGVPGTRPTEVGAPLLVQAGKLPATAAVPGDPALVAPKVRKPAKKKSSAKKAKAAPKAGSSAPAVVVQRPRVVQPVQRPSTQSAPAPQPTKPKSSSKAPKSSGSGSGSSGSGSGSGGDVGSGSGSGGD